MPDEPTSDITRLLREWRDGDRDALDRLMPLVYDQLRRLARRHMAGERRDHTLQPTALVHEAFGRLIGADIPWNDRVHFFAVAATTMRRILVEHARKANRPKRGGGMHRVTLEEGAASVLPPTVEILALDQALDRLAGFDPRKARVVELHYFGGMTYEEGAAALDLSPATFHRDLRLARAWLQRELQAEAETPSGR
ncbi:MAG: sigma-70 family RNA polymerase sigma factor [Acidobacteria bacterium]|nr:MAG: sigma-70 family RNA polymerase sigma factor [Acidobacteriota bacterium]